MPRTHICRMPWDKNIHLERHIHLAQALHIHQPSQCTSLFEKEANQLNASFLIGLGPLGRTADLPPAP